MPDLSTGTNPLAALVQMLQQAQMHQEWAKQLGGTDTQSPQLAALQQLQQGAQAMQPLPQAPQPHPWKGLPGTDDLVYRSQPGMKMPNIMQPIPNAPAGGGNPADAAQPLPNYMGGMKKQPQLDWLQMILQGKGGY